MLTLLPALLQAESEPTVKVAAIQCSSVMGEVVANRSKLAELVDLNIRSVQKIEAGQINVLVTTTMLIQNALDCPWGKLMS